MVNMILSSNHRGKAYYLIGLLGLMLLMQKADATNFMVGGSGTWNVPNNPGANSYNQWAEKNRFQVGDSLVFVYQANADSVLRVTKENFDSCNTNSPIEKFSDGHTSYKFNQSGHFYFISGNKDNCQKGEKLWLIVMADRTKKNQSNASPPAPSTAPTPAPSGQQAPSPPPAENNPTPSPVSEPHPPSKNAASSGYLSLLGSFVPLVAASIALVC